MKSKKKKRLLILIGVMLICLLPISFLSRVLVPWADELGEATTEVGRLKTLKENWIPYL